MFNQPINDENFILFAAHKYNNPACESEEEFYEDLNRVKYIKRLFFRFDNTGELKVRLLLTNVFGNEGATRILFHKSEEKYYGYVKTFLKYLNSLPEEIPELCLDSIATDHRIEIVLKEL
mgnify:FL=1